MISTERLTWSKDRKTLVGEASECGIRPGPFPTEVEVRSHHTGRIIKFVYDHDLAARCEWWDGEEAHYRPVEHCNAEHLVLIND